ncbi:ABC transporter substrate-binding protein [Desulfovirgula thermocuniculi]|uniref:ABC transporter substrate-binding protein n=1 Tax=Desulfovirgula thermocuniculi TaxID=348842 RepID=UPI00041C3250|nr:ABC transporter substrate-binding protein [Desulfovirgula thermocuniculi]
MRRFLFWGALLSCLGLFYLKGLPPLPPNLRLPVLESARSIVFLLPEEPPALDPANASGIPAAQVLSCLYEGLVRLAPGSPLKAEPCLSTRWEVSADGLQWTFYLRPGVFFHDGTPLDAEAVKFNVERAMEGRTRSPYAVFIYGAVRSVETVDRLTVRFNLKYPYAPFLYNLAMPAASLVSPQAAMKGGENFWRLPSGTGPFMLEKWSPGEITVKANPHYWGEKPGISRITFRAVAEPQARAQMLLSRRAHLAAGILPGDFSALEDKGFQILQGPGLNVSYLGFYTHKGPFRSKNVRRAALLTCNPREIAERLFPDMTVAAKGPLPPGVLGFEQTPEPPEPSPEKARRELAAAGYTREINITLLAYAEPRPYNPAGGEKLAGLIAEQLRRAGFNCTVRVYPWEEFKKALARQEGDAFIFGWTSDNGDPDNFLYPLFSSEQVATGFNTTRYSNTRVDTLLVTAQQAVDEEVRARIYGYVLQIIGEDVPAVFLHHGLYTLAVSGNLKGVMLSPQGLAFLNNARMIK